MRFDKFTLKVQEALQEAQSLAGSLGHQSIEPEHLLVCFLKQEDSIVGAILNKLNSSPQKI
jgi:ATP-dependent Clp protease ATP-binding subunit ClpB